METSFYNSYICLFFNLLSISLLNIFCYSDILEEQDYQCPTFPRRDRSMRCGEGNFHLVCAKFLPIFREFINARDVWNIEGKRMAFDSKSQQIRSRNQRARDTLCAFDVSAARSRAIKPVIHSISVQYLRWTITRIGEHRWPILAVAFVQRQPGYQRWSSDFLRGRMGSSASVFTKQITSNE